MRPGICCKLGLVLLAALLSGCGKMNLGGGGGTSNNEGKIEGTRWSNHAGSIKRAYFRSDVVRMDFRGDGSLFFQAGPERISGKYELGNGDTVYFYLDKAFAGSKNFTETITIAGDMLIMADPDGTSITFRKTGGPAAKPETPPETKTESKPELPPEPKPEMKPESNTKPETKPEPKPPEKPVIPTERKSEPPSRVKPEPDAKTLALRGLWSITEATYDGNKSTLDTKDCYFVITPERISLRNKGRPEVEATYSCDFTQLPAHIDLMWDMGPNQGKKALGLIQIFNGTVQLVLANPGQPRPTDFSAPVGAKHEKLVLEKPKFK